MSTVILIHGFPFNASLWDGILAGAVAPNLPGFGGAPPGPDTVEGYAQAILDAVEGVIVPIGHSMGGYVALAMHRLAPGRIAGMGFVASRASADTPEIRAKRFETAQQVLVDGVALLERTMMPRLFGPHASPEAMERARTLIHAADPQGAAAAMRAMAARPDSMEQLASIRVPALVVGGRHDAIVPPAETEAIARAIDGARLVWCERSGHMPMLEEREVLMDAFVGFAEMTR